MEPQGTVRNLSLDSVYRLAESCHYEQQHAVQVTKLALRLFDELKELHTLTQKDRFYLECAGILHDIGWVKGQEAHHKASLKIILESPLLAFKKQERLIVGSIARYHRSALPELKQRYFSKLSSKDRSRVARSAALLRLADGLDKAHEDFVKDVHCRVLKKTTVVACEVKDPSAPLAGKISMKTDLFEKVFGKKVLLFFEA